MSTEQKSQGAETPECSPSELSVAEMERLKRFAVPEGVLELLANMDCIDEHDDNGPGSVVCPACGGYARMRWAEGGRLDTPNDVAHSSDCPAKWAQALIASMKDENHD